MYRFNTLSLRSILVFSSVMGSAGAARCEPPITLAHISVPAALAPPVLPTAYGASIGTAPAPSAKPDPKQRWLERHRHSLCLQGETMRQARDMSLPIDAIIGAAFANCAVSAEPMSDERRAKLARLLGMLVSMQRMRAGEMTLAAVHQSEP